MLLDYNRETGIMLWLGKWRVGHRAGTPNIHGYRMITLDGVSYLEHRLAWLHAFGRWPAGYIDHVNGDPGDNRLSNLREATGGQNQINRGGSRHDSSSGCKCVRYIERKRKWVARLQIGSFVNLAEAGAAYAVAIETLGIFRSRTKQRNDNSSGMTGVRWHKGARKWATEIQIGSFDSLAAAQLEHRRAEKLLHGGFSPQPDRQVGRGLAATLASERKDRLRSPDGGLGGMDRALAKGRR